MKVAGIDQGTSSTRVMRLDDNGRSEILCSVKHDQAHPAARHVEQNGLELLRNVETCIRAAGKVNAIGIANQGESSLAWDTITREPLSPVLSWQDHRSSETVDRMRRDGSEAITLERAGLPLNPYFSASKLQWLMTHVPEVRRAHQQGRLRLGTTDAFLLHNLTGHCSTDLSTASRTCLLNLKTGSWDQDLCDLFQVPLETLPEIRPTVSDFGSFERIPITASIVDQQASLFGHGCRQRGDAKVTFGTGAFFLAHTGHEPISEPHTGLVPTVAWQAIGRTDFALEGGVFHAGSALAWLNNLGISASLEHLPPDASPAITRNLIFIPAMSGLGAPYWDASAGALWIGMTPATTAQDLCQSVLEGIALRIVEVVTQAGRCLPLSSSLSIDGGMAANSYLAQFLADASGRTVVVRGNEEQTSLGCAQLAALGAGVTIAAINQDSRTYTPKRTGRDLWVSQFGDAIRRCRNWHGSAWPDARAK